MSRRKRDTNRGKVGKLKDRKAVFLSSPVALSGYKIYLYNGTDTKNVCLFLYV